MSETENTSLARAIFHALILVAIVALQDPELRRNLAWGITWTAERVRAIIRPDEDEPPAPDVTKVIQAARDITQGG